MIKSILKALAVLIIILIFAGCGNNPPEINQVYSQINFIKAPDSDLIKTELLVLVNADDKDGEDNIEFLYIANDKRQILWRLDPDRRNSRNSRGINWIGNEHLVAVDGGVPSPGDYRVVITDMAGDRDEQKIFIPVFKEMPKAELFPSVEISEDMTELKIISAEKRNVLSFYDSEGRLIKAFSVTPGLVFINELNDSNISDEWKSLRIACYSNSAGGGLITGPYRR